MKAKSRKLPDARDARALRLCLRLAAVALSKKASDRCRIRAKDDESKKMARVQKKINSSPGENKSLKH